VVGKSGGFAAERLCQAKVGVAAVWQATEQAMEKAMSDRSKDGGAARGGERDAFVLLDDSLSRTDRCWLFERPMEVVRCDRPEDVEAALLRLAAAGANGLFGAGFLSYELGYLMEPKLAPLLPQDRLQPLLWFGLFDAPRELDSAAVGRWLETRIFGDYELGGLHWSLSQEDYLTAARRVKDYIAAGDVYQINLTLKGLFDFAGDPLALYRDLRRRQRVAHGALVVAPDFQVLSLSPELFLRVENGMAEARPMKGTAARGASPEEDAALGEWLSSDVKSRAENLMIVDLLRNDLGRVAPDDLRHHRQAAPRCGPAGHRPEPVSLRLDHRRAQVARHGDHPRARAGTAGRLHGRHRHAGTGRRCAVQRGDPYGLS
jgi:hypothetical protein